MAALTAATTAEEDETQAGNKITRKSVTRSMPSVLDQLRKYETHGDEPAVRLGLDPASRRPGRP